MWTLADLCSLLGEIEGDALADFRGKLTQHLGFETADHDPAQVLVQIL